MSYKATAWAYDLPLRSPAKPVLVALADFADEAGSCYPGQDRIAAMTGLSVRTVRRAVESLEAGGLIRREARYDGRGHRTSDRYFLALTAQSLPDTLTAGQIDRRSESQSLPDTQSIPTGHSDRVTVSRTTSDPSGGREAPTAPWCSKHPGNTDQPCRGCRDARRAYDLALASHTVPAHVAVPRYDFDVYCEHLQIRGKCEMCEYEQKHAAEVVLEQFGSAS